MQNYFFRAIQLSVIFCLAGCAQGDSKTPDVATYYNSNRTLIREQYHQILATKNYEWILHLHFRGLDMATASENQTELAPNSSSPLLSKEHPFQTLSLAEDEAAILLDFNYRNSQILGTMKYRNSSGDRALKAISHLFNCSSGTARNLDKVLFVLSGGSMGAGEAQYFAKELRNQCGKTIDALVLGDAIVRTGYFPMGSFANIPDTTPCLNFFENNPLLHGKPVRNCINVNIPWAGHELVHQSGILFINAFFKDLGNQSEPVAEITE